MIGGGWKFRMRQQISSFYSLAFEIRRRQKKSERKKIKFSNILAVNIYKRKMKGKRQES
jgi:hypothetical protein